MSMLSGPVLAETCTGVLDVRVTLTFHTARGRVKPAAGTPDRVIPLAGAPLTTRATPSATGCTAPGAATTGA
ncbi:hypothetical protein ACF064_19790 [Streptomyces sp. NPDC015492]|uniref:hypothetical protein n=1 Tax=Streptomyces sp. NPDC015492 TaxID=3364958 RepID=UPI0036F7C503